MFNCNNVGKLEPGRSDVIEDREAADRVRGCGTGGGVGDD